LRKSRIGRSTQSTFREEESEDDDEEENVTISRGKNSDRNANRYTMTKLILSGAGKCVMNYFRITPRPTFLLGSLDKEVATVTKKVRQKRAVEKTVEGKETKIKELSGEGDESEKNSTVNEINAVFKTLRRIYKRSGGTLFYHLINDYYFKFFFDFLK
jgi:hypothetical protein